jgi:hypothetical protein
LKRFWFVGFIGSIGLIVGKDVQIVPFDNAQGKLIVRSAAPVRRRPNVILSEAKNLLCAD